MGAHERKTHKLTVTTEDGIVMLRCARGDLAKGLGQTPTPDEIAREAGIHWGTAPGWWS
ncbi:hypothetical protein [Microbacterium sp. 5K110]|jgi:hypothetical protein|uniref:hypothetical protein n=1 Tax=Microbacterium sp. 5K110 TaxID=2578104 RepID=UPI001484D81C|nr:hypothetical protein [Microbacterium sp. 5K110]